MSQTIVENTVAQAFAKFDDVQRNRFVDDTLASLSRNMRDPKSQKRFRRIMMKLQVRKELLPKEQQWINQIVVSFLWAMKEEFRHQMSYMIYLIFRQEPPTDLQIKIDDAHKYQYIHANIFPNTFTLLESYAHRTACKNYDQLFQNLLKGVGLPFAPTPKDNPLPTSKPTGAVADGVPPKLPDSTA